jgi:transcriptional regulator of met regulon
MQRRKHKRLRFATESELLEQTRLVTETAKDVVRDLKKVMAESHRIRKLSQKARRNSN